MRKVSPTESLITKILVRRLREFHAMRSSLEAHEDRSHKYANEFAATIAKEILKELSKP